MLRDRCESCGWPAVSTKYELHRISKHALSSSPSRTDVQQRQAIANIFVLITAYEVALDDTQNLEPLRLSWQSDVELLHLD